MKFFNKYLYLSLSLFMALNIAVNSSCMKPLNERLSNACIGHKLEKIKNLIKNGADVNHRFDFDGHTPIADAMEFIESDSYFLAVELLIQAGAKINEKVTWIHTGLEEAFSCAKPDILKIRLFLNYGADITLKAIESARCSSNSKELEAELAMHEDLRKRAETIPSKEILDEVITFDNPFVAKLLIAAGLEITAEDLKQANKANAKAVTKVLAKHLGPIVLTNFLHRELARGEFPVEIPCELISYILKLAKVKNPLTIWFDEPIELEEQNL